MPVHLLALLAWSPLAAAGSAPAACGLGELSGDGVALEGLSETYGVAPEGCEADLAVSFAWSGDAIAACTTEDFSFTCDYLDDGAGLVTASAEDPLTGEPLAASLEIQAYNADPLLRVGEASGEDDFADGELSIWVGQVYTEQWVFDDVEADPITVTVEGAPDGFQLSETGRLLIYGSEPGSWDILVRLEDDDGGVSEQVLTLNVLGDAAEPADEDRRCGCDGRRTVPLGSALLALPLFRRRRTRPGC